MHIADKMIPAALCYAGLRTRIDGAIRACKAMGESHCRPGPRMGQGVLLVAQSMNTAIKKCISTETKEELLRR